MNELMSDALVQLIKAMKETTTNFDILTTTIGELQAPDGTKFQIQLSLAKEKQWLPKDGVAVIECDDVKNEVAG